MEYLFNLPTEKFIVMMICIVVITTIAILGFGGELMQLAKAKIAQKKDNESDSDKLDFIKELLETKNDALTERIERTEKSIERIERNVEGLVSKMDEGFRSVHKRLDEHIDSSSQILPKPYYGQERRGGAR
jgi:biopolymer transport protein ExbB/TolQ